MYPANCTRCVLEGHVGADDIFQTSFWIYGYAPEDNTDAATMAGQVQAAFDKDAKLALCGLLDNTSAYTAARVYGYTEAGTKANTVGEAEITDGVGTVSSIKTPGQASIVATLLTGQAGRSFRGRMFLPATGLTLSTPGNAGGGNVNPVASALAAMFEDLADVGSGAFVSVVSQRLGSAFQVTSVRCTDKVDTQRRRVNKYPAMNVYTAPVSS